MVRPRPSALELFGSLKPKGKGKALGVRDEKQAVRRLVADEVCRLIGSRGIRAHEHARVLDALQRHADHNVHFADAYFAASGAQRDKPVASFDRDFDKFKDVKRVEPS